MPLIRLETSEALAPDDEARLCAELSQICAAAIGKPEAYVMAVVVDGLAMLHAGKPGPAAFVDIRSIGALSPEVNRQLSQKLCTLLARTIKVPGERVYLNFTSVAATHWGHDGATFG